MFVEILSRCGLQTSKGKIQKGAGANFPTPTNIMFAVLALAFAMAMQCEAMYFDCYKDTNPQDCETTEFCVWLPDQAKCGLSAQSLYLLCLEDMTIPEETCLPSASVRCALTTVPEYCSAQTPCLYNQTSEECEVHHWADEEDEEEEVATESPTSPPPAEKPTSRKQRVQCCAHTWRVCYPTALFKSAPQELQDKEVERAKKSCGVDEDMTMERLCVGAREALRCPRTRRLQ